MKRTIITNLLEPEKVDPSTDMDTISNDTTEQLEFDEEGNVIVNEGTNIKNINISQVTPMTIFTSKSPSNQDIGVLVFLCKDQQNDCAFNLIANYIIENEEQKKIIESNPIHDNNNYISKRLASNMIISAIPSYITDMKFYHDFNTINPNEKFFMYGVPNKSDSKEVYKINMTADIFSSIAFMDDFLASDSHNIHDLQIATIAGYKQSASVVPVIFVDTIDSIISLASDKETSQMLVVFKVLEFTNSNSKNVYKILTAFDFGKKYPKKKFRGNTLQSLEDQYGNDTDQYLSNYMIDCRLENTGKEYLAIKAKNKDGICKLFFFDNDAVKKIEELIELY